MPKINKQVLRILDANLNRAKEGLRVCEDTLRFIFNSQGLTKEFKIIRHRISEGTRLLDIKIYELLNERDILGDIGKINLKPELNRKNISDIFFANLQRVKESLRVLEEFSKLVNRKASAEFKKIRYKVYEVEKKIIKRFPTLFNS